MPRLDVVVDCPVYDSFRVQQVAGLFDVPLAERSEAKFSIEVPDLDADDWQVGLIVGPSGSGKSTVARELFGDKLYENRDWPTDKAVVDGFGDISVKKVLALLTSVGFSSPPSWVKPYRVLSVGEQFRCDLARALAVGIDSEEKQMVAFDEFTSVVDRQVAQIGSAAIARTIRKGRVNCRFVAVTCHYDVAEWLEADWVLDMSTGECSRRRLRRPKIAIEVFRCHRDLWKLFKKHHYLSGSMSSASVNYVALLDGTPVAFCAVLGLLGHIGKRRISRIVTLPDFQGIGIGMKLAEAVGEIYADQSIATHITASHPAVIGYCHNSPRWQTLRVTRPVVAKNLAHASSYNRLTVSFAAVPEGFDHATAEKTP